MHDAQEGLDDPGLDRIPQPWADPREDADADVGPEGARDRGQRRNARFAEPALHHREVPVIDARRAGQVALRGTRVFTQLPDIRTESDAKVPGTSTVARL